MKGLTRYVRIGVAFAIWFFVSWLLNNTIYASSEAVAPFARDASQIFSVLLSLVGVLIALYRPRIIHEKAFSIIFAMLAFTGVIIAFVGVLSGMAVVTVLGTFMRASATAWMGVVLGLALATLSSRGAAIVLAWAFVAKYALSGLCANASYGVLVGLLACAVPLSLLLARRYAAEFLEEVQLDAPQASLQITSPRSFLPFTHTFFICILMLNAASGYVFAFDAVDSMPKMPAISVVPLLAIAFYCIGHEKLSADILYSVSTLFVIAGFLFVPIYDSASTLPLPQAFLQAGSDCFSFLIWFVMSRLALRNPSGACSVLFVFSVAENLGIELGAVMGHAANALNAFEPHMSFYAMAIVVLVFIGYNLIAMKPFSFDATIEQIRPVSRPIVHVAATSIEDGCGRIAEEFHLTKREAEILGLLARGRNVQAIQEKLVVSRNTVKTHVKNVYAKMNVHSQQELIDMVESRCEA